MQIFVLGNISSTWTQILSSMFSNSFYGKLFAYCDTNDVASAEKYAASGLKFPYEEFKLKSTFVVLGLLFRYSENISIIPIHGKGP